MQSIHGTHTGKPFFLLNVLFAGILTGVVEITHIFAFATPIYSNELIHYLPQGMGIILLGAMVCMVVFSAFSSHGGILSGPQAVPAALIGIMAAAVMSAHAATGVTDRSFYTVVTLMVCSTLLTGVVMTGLGLSRLGKIIRFIPFPVIGGLLASAGWILVGFSITIMTDIRWDIFSMGSLLAPEAFPKWLSALAVAMVLLWGQNRFRSPLAFPLLLVSCIVVFYLVLFISGASIDQAQSNGFLLDLPGEPVPFLPPLAEVVEQTHWKLVLEQVPLIFSVCILSCIVALVNASSIEILVDRDLDMDRDLRTLGISNILAGMGGGMPSYNKIFSTDLAHRLSPAPKLVILTAAGVCAAPFLVGSAWMSYFPLPVLAGIVLCFGILLLNDWLIKLYGRISLEEYLTALAVFLVTIMTSYPIGILMGTFCGMALFIVRYSHFTSSFTVLSGQECRSTVMRTSSEEIFLDANENAVVVVPVTGFLFFGTSGMLYESIQKYIQDENPELEILVMDFQEVPSVDSTSILGLGRIKRLLDQKGIRLIVSSVHPQYRNTVIKTLFGDDHHAESRVTDSTDQALERAEDWRLDSFEEKETRADLLDSALESAGFRKPEIEIFYSYCKERKLSAGDRAIQSGSLDSSVFFIESGMMEVVQQRGEKKIRLRVYTPGSVVGEMAVYNHLPRSADVFCVGETVYHALSGESLERMESREPAIAFKVHRFLARNLASKLLDDVQLEHIRK
ncbi:MAG: SulP family inorganic anion transporter [Gammaproteobacteria bacterium]|nr:SulP family inorganic anion transporter [Gammaproteobacteria bacterium]